jgi:hypothetical protein
LLLRHKLGMDQAAPRSPLSKLLDYIKNTLRGSGPRFSFV